MCSFGRGTFSGCVVSVGERSVDVWFRSGNVRWMCGFGRGTFGGCVVSVGGLFGGRVVSFGERLLKEVSFRRVSYNEPAGRRHLSLNYLRPGERSHAQHGKRFSALTPASSSAPFPSPYSSRSSASLSSPSVAV